MAQENDYDKKGTTATGSDLPNATGELSDEDINAIDDGCGRNAPTGQDHSTENRGDSMPDSGVGAVQNSSDTTSDVARIDD